MKVVLASASARRQELLHRIVEDFSIIVSDFDEDKVKYTGDVEEYVMEIAKGKADDVRAKVLEDCIIISADTIVTLDNKILGKPKDKKEAYNMIKSLSGRTHRVYSGIIVLNSTNGEIIKKALCTEVVFSSLSEEEIMEYINSEEPYDKAGAYGIQGKAALFVKEIRGCYYNVVGLPLNKLNEIIKKIQT
ncbi:MAG: Maf-like protein [Clostridium sp.]